MSNFPKSPKQGDAKHEKDSSFFSLTLGRKKKKEGY